MTGRVSVSIIMPVYNCDAFLREQIDSLLNQTFTDFELIVVNDRSTDLTASILCEYINIDARIKVFQNEFPKGIAGGLNTGLKYAIGKYIARADGDDIHLPERIRTQFDFLEKNPLIDILGSGALIFDKNGIVRKSIYPKTSIRLGWSFISNTYFCHPSVMFRSSLYKEHGGYPLVKVEDFAYFSLIIKSHRGYNLPIQLLHYRVHDRNYSSTDLISLDYDISSIFRENYRYYVPDMSLVDDFYLYQVHKLISPRVFFKLFFVNNKILNKIRIDYKLKAYNTDFLINIFEQSYHMLVALFNYINKYKGLFIKEKFKLKF